MTIRLMAGHVLAAMTAVLVGFADVSAGQSGPFGSAGYRWRQSDEHLTLVKDDKTVWQLNFDRKLGKPYFHPLALADGTLLTWDSPPDHPWHHGLWFSWKFINGLNYWEEDPNTGLTEGRNELVDAKITTKSDYSARIEMALSYSPPGKPVVLAEKRLIKVSPPDKQGGYHIDWHSIFTAIDGDVVLDRTPIPGEPEGKPWGGYAGVSVRIAKDLANWLVSDSEGRQGLMTHGQNARWMDFSGQTPDEETAGITILDHATNLRHPAPWFVSMDAQTPFGYFSPAILFYEPCAIKAGESLELKYRIIVHPGLGERGSVESEWTRYVAFAVPTITAAPSNVTKPQAKGLGGPLDKARGILNEFKARRLPPKKKPEFCGLDLSDAPRVDSLTELPDLSRRDPNDPNDCRLRKEVVVARHPEHWSDGVIYYSPVKNRYYIALEPGHPGKNPIYGPFKGKPWKTIKMFEPRPTKEKYRFAIYLVADPIDVGDPNQTPLEQLRLASEPIITEEDLKLYDWPEHILELADGVIQRIPPASVWGIPFVVMADGERCYLGAFWSAGSSYMPKTPMAYLGMAPGTADSKNSLHIRPAPIAGIRDPRADRRIRRVLEELNFVKPEKAPAPPRPTVAPLDSQLQRGADFSHWTRSTTFGQAIDDIRNSVDPPLRLIVLWRDLYENAAIDQQTEIRMDGISGVPLGVALKSVLMAVTGNPGQLGYVVDGGVITVGTKDSLREKWQTRVYNVQDLF